MVSLRSVIPFVSQKDSSFPLLAIKPSSGNGLNMIEDPSA